LLAQYRRDAPLFVKGRERNFKFQNKFTGQSLYGTALSAKMT